MSSLKSLKLMPDKSSHLQLPASLVLSGINKTLFATADDELRPVMNGISN